MKPCADSFSVLHQLDAQLLNQMLTLLLEDPPQSNKGTSFLVHLRTYASRPFPRGTRQSSA